MDDQPPRCRRLLTIDVDCVAEAKNQDLSDVIQLSPGILRDISCEIQGTKQMELPVCVLLE